MIRALRSAARVPAVISGLAATALTGLVSQPVLAHAVGKPFQYDRRLDQIEAMQLEPADQQWPGRKPSLEAPYLHHLRL